MPANRVGDTWTVDLPDQDFPLMQGGTDVRLVDLTDVIPAETYHIIATGALTFTEPETGPYQLEPTIGLNGYDATTGNPIDWDGLGVFVTTTYNTPGAMHTVPFVAQQVTDYPANCNLKAELTGVGDTPVSIHNCRFVFTIVASR